MWTLEARYKRGDFESKTTLVENYNKFSVSGIDFADMATDDDFELAGRMLIEVSGMLKKLNGE